MEHPTCARRACRGANDVSRRPSPPTRRRLPVLRQCRDVRRVPPAWPSRTFSRDQDVQQDNIGACACDEADGPMLVEMGHGFEAGLAEKLTHHSQKSDVVAQYCDSRLHSTGAGMPKNRGTDPGRVTLAGPLRRVAAESTSRISRAN